MAKPILSIQDLSVDYVTPQGPVRALDRVSLDLAPGEILGLAGESGSGKTTLAKSILRILPPPAVITGGRVIFEDEDILTLEETKLRDLRWSRISMVFQSAMNALNPVVSIGEQLTDTIVAEGKLSEGAAQSRAEEMLNMVGIPKANMGRHSHQLSGGMRQRVGIAMALALEPSLVILDEPTTALDVIVEKEILSQIKGLQQTLGFAVLFITHDLARMLQICDRVAIFYAGRLAESAPSRTILEKAGHPYSRGLLNAFPTVSRSQEEAVSIPGSPPSLSHPPSGCRFHPRCHLAEDRCRTIQPELKNLGNHHAAACHLAE